MDGSNSMLGRPKTKENYHTSKLFGFLQFRSFENSAKTMEEFNEEDIWDGVVDADVKQAGVWQNGCNGVEESIIGKQARPNISICHEENNNQMRNQSSAPVNIPLWNDMLWGRKKNIENCWRKRRGMIPHNDNSGDDDSGDDEGNMIPPHELIAMHFDRNEIASLSAYEGVGRTLKGRDAVWTMTGFIE